MLIVAGEISAPPPPALSINPVVYGHYNQFFRGGQLEIRVTRRSGEFWGASLL